MKKILEEQQTAVSILLTTLGSNSSPLKLGPIRPIYVPSSFVTRVLPALISPKGPPLPMIGIYRFEWL